MWVLSILLSLSWAMAQEICMLVLPHEAVAFSLMVVFVYPIGVYGTVRTSSTMAKICAQQQLGSPKPPFFRVGEMSPTRTTVPQHPESPAGKRENTFIAESNMRGVTTFTFIYLICHPRIMLEVCTVVPIEVHGGSEIQAP